MSGASYLAIGFGFGLIFMALIFLGLAGDSPLASTEKDVRPTLIRHADEAMALLQEDREVAR